MMRWLQESIMVALQVPPPISEAELRRLSHQHGVEYAGGQILEKPMSLAAADVELAVGSILRAAAGQAGTAKALGSSMSYKCYPDDPSKFRKPDVSVVRLERL